MLLNFKCRQTNGNGNIAVGGGYLVLGLVSTEYFARALREYTYTRYHLKYVYSR